MAANFKLEKPLIFKNRGMLLEQIINQTIYYYNKNKIAYFNKKNLDIKFSEINRETTNINSKKTILKNSYISKKSTVDYYGIYKGQYISFEAKSSNKKSIPMLNIKEHQHKHLLEIKNYGGISFYIFFFKNESKLFLVDVSKIDFYNKKIITIDELKIFGKELEIIFPGIVDFLKYI